MTDGIRLVVWEQAEAMRSQSKYARLPERYKVLFSNSSFAPVSPERLSKMFLALVPANPNAAVASGELAVDQALYQSARAALSNFLGTCANFNIVPLTYDDAKANIQLSFTVDNYKRSLDATSALLKRWNNALSLVMRAAGKSTQTLTIDYVSTTDLTIWLSTAQEVLPVVLSFYNLVLEAVEKTLSTLHALRNLRESGIDVGVKHSINDIYAKNSSDLVKTFLAGINGNAVDGETASGLEVSANLLIEDITNGARVSVSYTRKVIPTEKDGHPDDFQERQQKIGDLIEKNEQLELKVARHRDEVETLLISAPKDPTDN